MADSFLTLADLAKVNDKNNWDMGISDLLQDAPVLAALAAEGREGTTHKYIKEVTAPTVGFRAVNTGRFNSKSGDQEVSVDMKLLDCSLAVDVAIADQYHKGPAAYMAREAIRHLKAGYFQLEQQILLGVGNESDGFAGLIDNDQLDDLGDEMVVDGGGSGTDTESVWAIRTGEDLRDMAVITGMEGNIQIGETITQFIVDSDGKRYAAYCIPIHAWYCIQIGGARSVGRLANIDAGATLNDDKIAKLLAKFPASRGPSFLAMSREARRQLQDSRTATNSTGAPAPFPTEAFGVPIITTDAITATETAATTTTA